MSRDARRSSSSWARNKGMHPTTKGPDARCSATTWPILATGMLYESSGRATDRLTWCDGERYWTCSLCHVCRAVVVVYEGGATPCLPRGRHIQGSQGEAPAALIDRETE
ncbi:hypothetical protein BKA80DRAFT_286207 [Phyllosticta citrichinensis]